MFPYLLWCVVCWLCLYFATSQDATQDISGPEFLVTDGTRNLTLACPNTTYMVDRFRWFTPGSGDDLDRCEPLPVCTFQPRLDDDDHNVTCVAFKSAAVTLYRAFYQVNLRYPPQFGPVIKPSGKETLQQGDVITCTVSGGKPRVTNMTFFCEPDHEDQEDDVSEDGRDVSSSITVNTSATNSSINCTCSAFWAPEPGLYNDTAQEEFDVGQSTPEMNPKETTVTPQQAQTREKLSIGAIAGIAAAVLVLIVVVIVIVVCIAVQKSRSKKEGNKSQESHGNPSMAMGNVYSQPYTGPVQAQGSQGRHPNTTSSPSPYEDVQADEYDHLGRLKAPPTRPDPTYSHTNEGFVMS